MPSVVERAVVCCLLSSLNNFNVKYGYIILKTQELFGKPTLNSHPSCAHVGTTSPLLIKHMTFVQVATNEIYWNGVYNTVRGKLTAFDLLFQ